MSPVIDLYEMEQSILAMQAGARRLRDLPEEELDAAVAQMRADYHDSKAILAFRAPARSRKRAPATRPEPRLQKASVYFIQAVAGGPIKIGYSSQPHYRLADIQIASPVPLRLLRMMPGKMSDERRIQRRFAAARMSGEWFEPVPELLEFIASIPSAEP